MTAAAASPVADTDRESVRRMPTEISIDSPSPPYHNPDSRNLSMVGSGEPTMITRRHVAVAGLLTVLVGAVIGIAMIVGTMRPPGSGVTNVNFGRD